MSEMKKMIQVGTGGFGVYWLESIIPRVSDFARLVAAVDVKASERKMLYGFKKGIEGK